MPIGKILTARKTIVIQGNLSDGFTFIGPFDSFDDAALSLEGQRSETWIATLENPSETE